MKTLNAFHYVGTFRFVNEATQSLLKLACVEPGNRNQLDNKVHGQNQD